MLRLVQHCHATVMNKIMASSPKSKSEDWPAWADITVGLSKRCSPFKPFRERKRRSFLWLFFSIKSTYSIGIVSPYLLFYICLPMQDKANHAIMNAKRPFALHRWIHLPWAGDVYDDGECTAEGGGGRGGGCVMGGCEGVMTGQTVSHQPLWWLIAGAWPLSVGSIFKQLCWTGALSKAIAGFRGGRRCPPGHSQGHRKNPWHGASGQGYTAPPSPWPASGNMSYRSASLNMASGRCGAVDVSPSMTGQTRDPHCHNDES